MLYKDNSLFAACNSYDTANDTYDSICYKWCEYVDYSIYYISRIG